jgi:hypothetical protein
MGLAFLVVLKAHFLRVLCWFGIAFRFLTGLHRGFVPMPIVHDDGVSRLSCRTRVEKGVWYFVFICQHCGNKIYALENKTGDAIKQPIIGKGLFSVPCRSCGEDETLYKTSDLVPLQADEDIPSAALPRRNPSNRPRQPAAKRYPKAKPTFGPELLEDRPECAIIIARCIAVWSHIEVQLALLLASILKVNTKPALALYLAIQNSRIQNDALKAAAEAALSEHDYELFRAYMSIKSALEKTRNDFAHGIYGTSMLVKEGVLWMEQKDSAGHTARVWASDYTDMGKEHLTKTTFV